MKLYYFCTIFFCTLLCILLTPSEAKKSVCQNSGHKYGGKANGIISSLNKNQCSKWQKGKRSKSRNVSHPKISLIRPSLFPHVPPYLNFSTHNQAVTKPPHQVRKYLKWQIGTRPEYEAIKKTVKNSGSSQLFYKEKLWKNFVHSMTLHGKEKYYFVPQSYVLPEDLDALKTAITTKGKDSLWFVKPCRSSQGYRVHVISNVTQLPSPGKSRVVQEYIRPYLIMNRKFDLRIYVLVTSFRPLRIYLYKDGNVRFAAMPYTTDSDSHRRKFVHLTNEAVNKHSRLFVPNEDINSYNGHQWSLRMFWKYLQNQGVKTFPIKKMIKDIIIKTMIAAENQIMKAYKVMPNRHSAYQLFGFDIGLDNQLKPWLFEVNGSPTTITTSGLLLALKGKLFKEMFNIVGYHFPPTLSTQAKKILTESMGEQTELSKLTFDSRLYPRLTTERLNSKQILFETKKFGRSQYLKEILESLTPDDIRQLITAEDELSQCDGFARIFPTRNSHHYSKYFEKPRYHNLLLDAWENKYGGRREEGIKKLRALCQSKFHLNSSPDAFA